MVDVAALKQNTDLVSIVEADLGPPRRKAGRWLSWPCPFHSDSERDGGSLRVTSDTQTWFCFGCQQTGDAIAWVMKRRDLDFRTACRELGAPVANPSPLRRQVVAHTTAADTKPGSTWQQHAERILTLSQRYLWSENGKRALDYLRAQRGLNDETIKRRELGFNPGTYRIREILTQDGRPAVVAKGHVIPVRLDGKLQLLKIRQPAGCNPRYVRLAGGRTVLFGTDTLHGHDTILLTEGEFDAMLADQEAGDLVGVVSTTGGCKTWQPTWNIYLLAARRVLVAYDNDSAGDEAAAAVFRLSSRMRRVRVPAGKDLTEFWQRGGNLRAWIESLL